jgi:hypothetical protein
METLPLGTIISAVKAGHAVIDDNKRKTIIKRLMLLVRSNRKILIFGLSGVGKTQFIRSLKKSLEIPARTDVTEKTCHDLDDFPIQFIDTPGHSERQTARRTEIDNVIKHGVEGIINVVSYGYEENPDRKNDGIFDQQGKIKESFLNLNRKAEVDRLAEWVSFLQPEYFGWVINLINKADLWWDRPEEVLKYYESGDYSNSFKSIGQYKNIITLPYCSIIKPYYDTTTSGKFGDLQKEQMQAKLLHELLNLLKEE